MASALLLGFAGANAFALACLFAGPMSTTGSTADCGIEMRDTGDAAVGSPDDCCLSCVVDAALLDTGGLQAPAGIAVLSPLYPSPQGIVFSISRQPAARSVLPEISPPVFILNSSLLI